FLATVQDRDLSVSSLAGSAEAIDEALGFDPTRAEWELLGQAREGMVMILKITEDLDEIAESFASAGYARPADDALEGAVWSGGPDAVAGLGLANGELQNVAFIES